MAGPFRIRNARAPTLLVFGYVGCANTCPVTLRAADIALAQRAGRRPLLIFVDVDPSYDRLEVVRRFVARYRFVRAATADLETLAQLEASVGMRVVRTREHVLVHDGRVFVIGDDSAVLGTFIATSPADVRAALDRYAKRTISSTLSHGFRPNNLSSSP